MPSRSILLSSLLVVSACSTGVGPDGGAADLGASHDGGADLAVADLGGADLAVADLGGADTGVADDGALDADTADTGVDDASSADSGADDASSADSGGDDASSADGGALDGASGDADVDAGDAGITTLCRDATGLACDDTADGGVCPVGYACDLGRCLPQGRETCGGFAGRPCPTVGHTDCLYETGHGDVGTCFTPEEHLCLCTVAASMWSCP